MVLAVVFHQSVLACFYLAQSLSPTFPGQQVAPGPAPTKSVPHKLPRNQPTFESCYTTQFLPP